MISNKFRAGVLAFSSAIALGTTSVSAQDTTTIENAFSQCGIGAAIFTKNETAAIISNVIWDLGTTAFSSQTSSPESCAGSTTTAALFINETYPVLEEQFVKGSGSHVAALMEIMQCDTSAQSAIVSSVQNELSVSFSDNAFLVASQTEKAKKMSAMVDRAMVSCNA
jgi:hypothetical protein